MEVTFYYFYIRVEYRVHTLYIHAHESIEYEEVVLYWRMLNIV